MIALELAGVLALALVWRSVWRRRVERSVAERLPAGLTGIIAGAEPIELAAAAAPAGVLLLHGFGDTPQSLAHLAGCLHARGYRVSVPLLPGHGRTLRDFRRVTAGEWVGAARSALEELRRDHARTGVVGLSMGGALAVLLAAEYEDTSALVLLAPYLEPRLGVRIVARTSSFVGAFVPWLSGRDARSIHDPDARAQSRSYGVATPRLIAELVRVAKRARAALPLVHVPTLYIQSRADNRLTSTGAEHAFASLGAREKQLEWTSDGGHVITVDRGWFEVANLVGNWLDAHAHDAHLGRTGGA